MVASFIPSVLDELDDVGITSPVSGQVIRHNGVNWVNAQLAHSDLSGIGINTHAQIDSHISNGSIHFAETSINHLNIQNIGANTHVQIDTHIASTTNPHGTSLTQTNLTVIGIFDISNTAPTITLTDTDASSEDLQIDLNANIAQIRKVGGAANSLMSFDLATNQVGFGGLTAGYKNIFEFNTIDTTFSTLLGVIFTVDVTIATATAIGGNMAVSANTTTTANGLSYAVFNYGTGNITTGSSVSVVVANYGSGTFTNAYGVKVDAPGGSGTITNTIAVRVARDTGSRTRKHGFYYGAAAVGSEPAGNFAIYADSDNSYFGAKVGIGITPTAVLHLKAGTASANTTPLKLTAGTNLTTPEAGAVEWDGTNLYITQSGGTRKTIAYV